jgi:hypothetical protein
MNIYLYVKTHNVTGLKYLGKTTKDPLKYTGSGKYWLKHLKKHGNDVTTEVIFTTNSIEKFKEFSINYSIQNNIVESKEWANLILETGSGGDNPLSKTPEAIQKSKNTRSINKKQIVWTPESNLKRSISHKKYWESEKSSHRKSKPFCGPPKPRAYLSNNTIKVSCPHCGKEGQYANMKRWHFDNCKSIP